MMLVSIEDTCFVTGEWLNGRVAVSKTVGCVFESRLPCQAVCILAGGFFYAILHAGGVAGCV